MKNVAIILARGGSKTIPNKNIIEVCNRPLIYYTIRAAIMADVEETWVSTDSDEISAIAQEYGAKILKRPDQYATDKSSSEEALLHFCQNIDAENIVFIQPTSPLVSFKDINAGLKLLDKYDSIFSGCKEHWVPRWETFNWGLKEYQWNKNQRPRRQDRQELIIENGAFYISKRENILKNKLRYSGNIGLIEMPYSRSFQVDTYDDLLIIESLIKNDVWRVNV